MSYTTATATHDGASAITLGKSRHETSGNPWQKLRRELSLERFSVRYARLKSSTQQFRLRNEKIGAGSRSGRQPMQLQISNLRFQITSLFCFLLLPPAS